MAKVTPIATNWNAGEWSPDLDGRVDLEKYPNSSHTLENFLPMVQGPIRRRPGTRFVRGTKKQSDHAWLTRFIFNIFDSYVLEWGDHYLRFYTHHGQVLEADKAITGATQANPVVITAVGHGYASGNEVYIKNVGGMTQLNGRFFVITKITNDTFSLNGINGTGYSAYTAGGVSERVYEISTPYGIADLTDSVTGVCRLRYAQSADVVYFTNTLGTIPQYKLSRLGPTNWTLAAFPQAVATEKPTTSWPFKKINIDTTITVYASAGTGTVTVTANSAIFKATHVGSTFYMEQQDLTSIKQWEPGDDVPGANIYRRADGKTYKSLNGGTTGRVMPTHSDGSAWDGAAGTAILWQYHDAGYGWGKITAVAGDGLSCTLEVQATLGDTIGADVTYKWAFSAWSNEEGWPTDNVFWRERLVFADAHHVWASVADDFEDFRARNESGEVTDDMAISVRLPTEDPIQWLQKTTDLLVGTSGGEQMLTEANQSEPIGPANIRSVQQQAYGSRGIQALVVGDGLLYVQATGRKLRFLRFDFYTQKYLADDLSLNALHMSEGSGFVGMAWQQEPDQVLWLWRKDGKLIGFTFDNSQQVAGWHRHPLGGAGAVESMVVVPAPDGSHDEIWMIVRRTINGQSVAYVEYAEAHFESSTDRADAFYVDCGLTYSGAPATVIYGLSHLEGQNVGIRADGAEHPQRTVVNGYITLDAPASKVQIGLPRSSKWVSQRLEAGSADGTSQGKIKRTSHLTMRLKDTADARFGVDGGKLDPILERRALDAMGSPPPLINGDRRVAWPDGYTTDSRFCFEVDGTGPATLIAIMPETTTQDR